MRDLTLTLVVLALLLASWFALNRWGLNTYPDDPSEGGEYTVIRWASDPNPARVEQIALFNRLYADKKVRVVLDPSADVQKILTQAAAGSGPDVFDIYSYATFALYQSKGILVELNDYMRQAGLSLDDFWPQRRNALAVLNPQAPPQADEYQRYRIYCVPNNVNANVIFLNRSLYDAEVRQRHDQNLAMPPLPWNHWTWWDYVYLCQALTKKSADGRRYETFGAGGGGLENLVYQAGGRYLSPDGKAILIDSEAGATAAQVQLRFGQYLPCGAVGRRHVGPNRRRRLGRPINPGPVLGRKIGHHFNWALGAYQGPARSPLQGGDLSPAPLCPLRGMGAVDG